MKENEGGTNNICIGPRSGLNLTSGSNNILIGENAGADLTDECNVVIIGDNIRNLDKTQKNLM